MSRINKPIWKDTDIHQTGVTLQHLVNGSWQNTGMKVMPVPSGYTPDTRINRFAEDDLKSTKPDFSPETGITAQPYAYQVYKISGTTSEYGFINDWSYEDWSGDTRCLSAPINRHADSRQKLVYGNFAETGNSIIVKELIRADIKMQPTAITISAEQYQAITIVVTSNTYFELILPEWLTASQTAFTSGTTVAYLYPQTNTSFDSRQSVIQAKHEAYWGTGYEYTNIAQATQSGKVAYFTVTPDPLGIPYSGGSTYVTVYTNTDFTATTNSSDTWFTYSGKTEVGVNYYNVYFNVSANTGDNRQTHAYFEYVVNSSGGTYTRALRVAQAHAPYITVSPSSDVIEGSATAVTVTVYSEAPWEVVSEDTWLNSYPSSGNSGETTILIYASSNSGTTVRQGSVVFSNTARTVSFIMTQSFGGPYSIVYRSTDNQVVTPSGVFGANIVSNIYSGNYGVITFDAHPTKVGRSAFYNKTKLCEIILPKSIEEIGYEAFSYCRALTAITIPNSVKGIYARAFWNSGIKEFTMSDNIEQIDGDAIFGTVAINQSTPWILNHPNGDVYAGKIYYGYKGPGNVTINAAPGTRVLQAMPIRDSYNIGGQGPRIIGINIPNSVVSIAFLRFAGTSLNIPDSVETADYGAFAGCPNLTAITIGSGFTNLYLNAATIRPVTGYEFFMDSPLSSITVSPQNTTFNDGNGSNCMIRTSDNTLIRGTTVIPDGVESISWYAFSKGSLSSITIPSSVTSIGENAFNQCTALDTINYNDTMAQWANVTKGSNWNGSATATVVHCTDGDVAI